jgi:hypothetical protein
MEIFGIVSGTKKSGRFGIQMRKGLCTVYSLFIHSVDPYKGLHFENMEKQNVSQLYDLYWGISQKIAEL